MAILKEDLYAVPDGELYPRWFRSGEKVSGDVAEAARAQGKLAQLKGKAGKAPENK